MGTFSSFGLNQAYPERYEKLGDRLSDVGKTLDWDVFRPLLVHRFGLMPSLTLSQGEAIMDFTFNGEIRQNIQDFQKLNLEHENYIDIGVTILAGFICIH